MNVPFVIYADFETFIKKIDPCLPDPQKSIASTTPNTRFEPCGFGYQVVGLDDKYTKPPVVYRGPNVSKIFIECLEKQIKKKLKKFLKT